MSSRLINGLVTTDAVTAAFSDEQLLRAMYRFEVALARAEALAGVIPDRAAAAIAEGAQRADPIDFAALLESLRANATVSIAVVELLMKRVEVHDADAARYVHRGATSQDVYDTAMVLCLQAAWASIEVDHLRLIAALDALAIRHADAVMLGRTLLQPAVPTTFGLKAAGWLGSVARSWRVWSDAFDRTQVLQFGGAAGTLSVLGSHGAAVEHALADELGLEVPDAPWHVHRDRTVGFAAAAGVYVGALAKTARDVALLMQFEVGEVFEAGGGSSTMPHKRNPAGAAAVLACAQRMPGLVATMLGSMVQEHERGVGSSQVEGATLVEVVQTSAAAVAALADVVDHLTVDVDRMRQNIEATHGVVFAERVTMRLAPVMGRVRASALVKEAVATAMRSGRALVDVMAEVPELALRLDAQDRADLFDAASYLGSADVFRARLLTAASVPGSRKH